MANPLPIPAVLSLEEWARLDEDLPGELVDGHLTEEEVPSFIHERLVGLLWEQFRAWLGRDALIAGSESKLAVSDATGRKPDLSVWFPGTRLPPPDASVSRVPPDVALEIVTATPRDAQRDRVEKHNEYAAFGIRFYWLVDPTLRSLEVFELRAGAYSRATGVTFGAAVGVPGIVGASLDLDRVWAEVDDYVRRYAQQQP